MEEKNFTFEASVSCSRMTWGFEVPQTQTLRQLTLSLMWKITLLLNWTLEQIVVVLNLAYGLPAGRVSHTKYVLLSVSEQLEVCTVSWINAYSWFWRLLFGGATTQVPLSASIFIGRAGRRKCTVQNCLRSREPIKILELLHGYFRSNIFYRRERTLRWVVECETVWNARGTAVTESLFAKC
jgi:hypothetical protein